MACRLRCLFLYFKTAIMPPIMSARPSTPPTTPPAIAPVLLGCGVSIGWAGSVPRRETLAPVGLEGLARLLSPLLTSGERSLVASRVWVVDTIDVLVATEDEKLGEADEVLRAPGIR